MLKTLFSSEIRVLVLSEFFFAPDGTEFFVRELTRKLTAKRGRAVLINSVNYELGKLKKIGLLKLREQNHKKYFRLNKNFIILDELRSIFQKKTVESDKIAKKIARFGKVKLLILNGIFVGQKSNIDLFLVGELDKEKLNKYIENEFDL